MRVERPSGLERSAIVPSSGIRAIRNVQDRWLRRLTATPACAHPYDSFPCTMFFWYFMLCL